ERRADRRPGPRGDAAALFPARRPEAGHRPWPLGAGGGGGPGPDRRAGRRGAAAGADDADLVRQPGHHRLHPDPGRRLQCPESEPADQLPGAGGGDNRPPRQVRDGGDGSGSVGRPRLDGRPVRAGVRGGRLGAAGGEPAAGGGAGRLFCRDDRGRDLRRRRGRRTLRRPLVQQRPRPLLPQGLARRRWLDAAEDLRRAAAAGDPAPDAGDRRLHLPGGAARGRRHHVPRVPLGARRRCARRGRDERDPRRGAGPGGAAAAGRLRLRRQNLPGVDPHPGSSRRRREHLRPGEGGLPPLVDDGDDRAGRRGLGRQGPLGRDHAPVQGRSPTGPGLPWDLEHRDLRLLRAGRGGGGGDPVPDVPGAADAALPRQRQPAGPLGRPRRAGGGGQVPLRRHPPLRLRGAEAASRYPVLQPDVGRVAPTELRRGDDARQGAGAGDCRHGQRDRDAARAV
ncbi:MAG: Maltose/maltodextrin ABC transporter, substrate binding periplasmic protein MalE, partial [uncultured Thermomicrobiales bacterium]